MFLLVGFALALLPAPLQPVGSQQRHSAPAVTRRSFFTAAVATTAVGLFSPPAYALGGGLYEAATSDDPLATRLKQAREGISAIPAAAQSGDWDSVRRSVGFTLPFLSVKGYTGESVKSRAAALDEEPRAAMMVQRQALLVALATLDKAAYNVQTGKAKAYAVTDDVSKSADDAVAAIDALLTLF